MENFNAEQLMLIGYVVVALPFVVQGIRWGAAKLGYPLKGDFLLRMLSAVCAIGLAVAFGAPVATAPFPVWSGLGFEFAAAVLGFLATVIGMIATYVASAHAIYEYILRKVFDRTALASKQLK